MRGEGRVSSVARASESALVGVGGDCGARRGEVAIAEPWVGVDSSKPPRLFAPIDAGLPSQSFEEASAGGLATLERTQVAAANRVGGLSSPSHTTVRAIYGIRRFHGV